MRFKDYFSNDFETSDNHYLNTLRTHYYRCTKDTAFMKMHEIIKEMRANVKYEDKVRGEIIFEVPSFMATATIVSPTYSETAVDLKVTTFKGKWWLGRKLKIRIHLGIYILQNLYNLTDRHVEYSVNDNAGFQLFCGKDIVDNWHCPDHTKWKSSVLD